MKDNKHRVKKKNINKEDEIVAKGRKDGAEQEYEPYGGTKEISFEKLSNNTASFGFKFSKKLGSFVYILASSLRRKTILLYCLYPKTPT